MQTLYIGQQIQATFASLSGDCQQWKPFQSCIFPL